MIIVPCCGICNLGRLTVDAARMFFRGEEHKLAALGALAAGHAPLDKKMEILVINGCQNSCASEVLHAGNFQEKWSLMISDLGITKCDDGQYNKEELRLVMDALEAACVDVGDQVPQNLGSCGCC